MASFTPLVFSTSGGMSGCTNVFFKRLAYLFSLKKKLDYGNVMAWLRCRLSFSLLHSVYGEHDPTAVVRPTVVHLTWLWLRVKCVIMLIRCIFSPFFVYIALSTFCARGGGKGCRLPREKINKNSCSCLVT